MEQRLVEKNSSQCIYFMRETNLDFYLIIPNSRRVKIVLGIFDDIQDDFVKRIPVQGDNAVVIPVISKNILDQVNNVNSPSCKYLNQVLSFLINTSYKILVYNHIEVDNKILLNYNPKYEVFHKNFLLMYQGRVGTIELFPMISSINEKVESPVVKEPIISLEGVTLTDIPLQTSVIDNNNVASKTNESDSKKVEENKLKEEVMVHEPGFVSYVLLGVLVAVLSLVFLYFIL